MSRRIRCSVFGIGSQYDHESALSEGYPRLRMRFIPPRCPVCQGDLKDHLGGRACDPEPTIERREEDDSE